jgi:hypothetical protein
LEEKLNNYIPKSNEGLRYEIYIYIHVLAIKVFAVTNHVFEFSISKEWSLKCYCENLDLFCLLFCTDIGTNQ